jgi:hypothetical protein
VNCLITQKSKSSSSILLELGLHILSGDFNFSLLMLAMLASSLILHIAASDFPVAAAALFFAFSISNFHLNFLR